MRSEAVLDDEGTDRIAEFLEAQDVLDGPILSCDDRRLVLTVGIDEGSAAAAALRAEGVSHRR